MKGGMEGRREVEGAWKGYGVLGHTVEGQQRKSSHCLICCPLLLLTAC